MLTPKKLTSGRWSVRVFLGTVDGHKQYRRITADTKAECSRLAHELLAQREEELTRPADLTVRQAIVRYIDLSETLSPTTLSSYKKILAHAFPDLMDRPVKSLTDLDVQAAINIELKRPSKVSGRALSPKTVKNEFGLVSAALKAVCKRTFDVRLPRIQSSHPDLPDPARVIAAVRGSSVELPTLLAMWMSFSMSEIRGIMCSSVRDGFISIDRVTVDIGAQHITKSDAKTATRKRRVKAPDYILALIYQTPAYKAWMTQGLDGLIVPETRNSIYFRFKRRMKNAGISMTFHDLRHIYASTMLTTLGAPSKVVQDSGGWASPYVMDKVYSNMFDSTRAEWAEKRDTFFESLMLTETTNRNHQNAKH